MWDLRIRTSYRVASRRVDGPRGLCVGEVPEGDGLARNQGCPVTASEMMSTVETSHLHDRGAVIVGDEPPKQRAANHAGITWARLVA